ncbi:nitroreductase family protein [Candidatus Woesearchaeota archaeon]|nr:nitroreductase family protein [Candidatus Woesearchaeota archaeon]
METQECIRTRRSVRKYKDKAVDWDRISQILDAGRFAPSAGNLQNWKFIVVRKEEVIRKLSQAAFDQGWMEDAPVHIVIASEPKKAERFYGARGEHLYTMQGCAAVIENMLLTANDLSLGACWVGAFDESKVRRAINMPETAFPQAIITLGYADETPNMPPKIEPEHLIFLERWGGSGQGYRAKGYSSETIKESLQNTKKAIKKAVRKLRK